MARKRSASAFAAIFGSGLLVRVFLAGQLQRALLGLAEVPFLDRQRPPGQLGDRLLASLLVQFLQHHPVADLAGLGHRHELEAVEPVGVVAEVGLHHLGGLAFGLFRLLENRRLLAVALIGDLGAAARGLLGLLAHVPQFPGDPLVVDQALDFFGRFRSRFRQPQHLRQLLLQSRQLSHRFLQFGVDVALQLPPSRRRANCQSQTCSKRRPPGSAWSRPIEARGARRRSVGLPGLKIWKPSSSSCSGRWLWPKTTASTAGKRRRRRASRPCAGPASWTIASVRPPSSTSSVAGSELRSAGSSTLPWTAWTTGQRASISASAGAAKKSPAWSTASASPSSS